MTRDMDTVKMSYEEVIDTLKGLVFGTFDRTTVKEREALDMAIKALQTQAELSEDCVSRKSLIHKLQERHDFFVDAYGGFINLPQKDKARVDAISNCIAMVVNEPSVKPVACIVKMPVEEVVKRLKSEGK